MIIAKVRRSTLAWCLAYSVLTMTLSLAWAQNAFAVCGAPGTGCPDYSGTCGSCGTQTETWAECWSPCGSGMFCLWADCTLSNLIGDHCYGCDWSSFEYCYWTDDCRV